MLGEAILAINHYSFLFVCFKENPFLFRNIENKSKLSTSRNLILGDGSVSR